MKIFYDTEFIEGTQPKKIMGFIYGHTKPTIDLISIALIDNFNNEYYAISKDFNIDYAWFKSDSVSPVITEKYWLRHNVLYPIYKKLVPLNMCCKYPFTLKTMKHIIYKYGKSNSKIKEDIIDFANEEAVKLYGYYSDYDHVVLSWLFGNMSNLPLNFPMYTIDIKQIADDILIKLRKKSANKKNSNISLDLKKHPLYPENKEGHDALSDAKWTKDYYYFLMSIREEL